MTATTGKRPRRWDIIIIAGILALALIGFVAVRLYSANTQGNTVEISSPDGDVYLPLDEDTTYTVSTDLGYNTVVISGGKVHIEEADCRNQLCVEAGIISTPGQTLICLPHKVVVKIVDGQGTDDNQTGLDTVSS